MKTLLYFISLLLPATFAFAQVDIAPIVTAMGQQNYCPSTSLNIVTAFDITDADDTGALKIFIQISSGYVNGQDLPRECRMEGVQGTLCYEAIGSVFPWRLSHEVLILYSLTLVGFMILDLGVNLESGTTNHTAM